MVFMSQKLKCIFIVKITMQLNLENVDCQKIRKVIRLYLCILLIELNIFQPSLLFSDMQISLSQTQLSYIWQLIDTLYQNVCIYFSEVYCNSDYYTNIFNFYTFRLLL